VRVEEKGFRPDRTFAVVKDLADPDSGVFVFEYAARILGVVDALINNAAWSFLRPMLDVGLEEFDRLVAVNQKAPFFLAQEFLRQLSKAAVLPHDPVIINIGSVNALAGNPNLVPYAGTKGALAAMTRAMAVEMQEFKVRINTVSPASVKTDVTNNFIASGIIDPPKVLERHLTKRFASCDEVAALVAYLCSEAATYVNGANWVIDGGYLAQ